MQNTKTKTKPDKRKCSECGRFEQTSSIKTNYVCSKCKRKKGQLKPSWIGKKTMQKLFLK